MPTASCTIRILHARTQARPIDLCYDNDRYPDSRSKASRIRLSAGAVCYNTWGKRCRRSVWSDAKHAERRCRQRGKTYMFEYFKNNYAWNLTAIALMEEIGNVTQPCEAFAAVRDLEDAPPD